MVIIRMSARHHEADQHRNNKDRHSIERIDPNQRCQNGNMEPRHDQKRPSDIRMFCADPKSLEISGQRQPPRIFLHRHDPAVRRPPSGLVFGLIHVMIMVPQIVMQDPDIRHRAGL